MSSFFSMCFFWNLASLTETVMSVSLYYKSDRRLCSCFIRAPHMWVAPEKIAADIDLCSPAEMEKIVRAKEETDLTDWCREHDLASIEQSFRSEEIHTIENLAECRYFQDPPEPAAIDILLRLQRLTEQDLKEYIGIKDIYTRKRVGRLIRLLQGDTEGQTPIASQNRNEHISDGSTCNKHHGTNSWGLSRPDPSKFLCWFLCLLR